MNLKEKKYGTASRISDLRTEVNNFIIQKLNSIGVENITVSHGNILFTLFKYESLTMKELSEKINRDASTVTTLIKKLHKNDYVVIKENTSDTRSKIVSLSSKTLSLKDDFMRISEDLNESFWEGINDEEAQVFMKCIDKIIENFKIAQK